MKESIHGHECADESTVFLIGFLAVGSASGVTGTAITINRRDYFREKIEKRDKKR